MRPAFLITSLTLALAVAQAGSARAQAGSVVSVGVDGVLREPRGGLDHSLRAAALVRVRFRPGLTPALGIGGFSSDWSGGRMVVRTLMAGPSYRIERGRVSYSASVVAGYAFGRLEGGAPGRTLHGNWALQPSLGVWYDLSERFGVRVSAGYLMARLPSRQDDAGIARTTHVRVDAMELRVGVAYAIF